MSKFTKLAIFLLVLAQFDSALAVTRRVYFHQHGLALIYTDLNSLATASVIPRCSIRVFNPLTNVTQEVRLAFLNEQSCYTPGASNGSCDPAGSPTSSPAGLNSFHTNGADYNSDFSSWVSIGPGASTEFVFNYIELHKDNDTTAPGNQKDESGAVYLGCSGVIEARDPTASAPGYVVAVGELTSYMQTVPQKLYTSGNGETSEECYGCWDPTVGAAYGYNCISITTPVSYEVKINDSRGF